MSYGNSVLDVPSRRNGSPHASPAYPVAVLLLSLLAAAGAFAPWLFEGSGYSSTTGDFVITYNGLRDWGVGNSVVALGLIAAGLCVWALLRPGITASLGATSLLFAASTVGINQALEYGATSDGWNWQILQRDLEWGLPLVVGSTLLGAVVGVAWIRSEVKRQPGADRTLASQLNPILPLTLVAFSATLLIDAFARWSSGSSGPGWPVALSGVDGWGTGNCIIIMAACVVICGMWQLMHRSRGASIVACFLLVGCAAICTTTFAHFRYRAANNGGYLHADWGLTFALVVVAACLATSVACVAVGRTNLRDR